MSSLQQLRRSPSDRKVFGLCGGVAQQWAIDPLLVRVLAVLLAVSGGIGVVLYLAGWLLIPEDGHPDSVMATWIPQSKSWPREVWIVATVVACIACVSVLGSIAPVGLAPALIIVAVWYFGFRHRGPSGSAKTDAGPSADHLAPSPARVHDPLAGPPTPFTQAARQWQARMAQQNRAGQPYESSQQYQPSQQNPSGRPRPVDEGASAAPTAAAGPSVADPPASRDPYFSVPDPVGLYAEPAPAAVAVSPHRAGAAPAARRLRSTVLIVAALALAALALVDALGVTVPWVLYPATALLIIGLGLVIATWTGRAKGLLALGIVALLATPLTQLGSHAAGSIPTQWGSAVVAYQTQTELPPSTSFAGGDYTVDLSHLTMTTPQTYTVHLQMGSLRVKLPRDARVAVTASTSIGAVQLPDREAGGKVAGLEGVYGPAGHDAPTLTIKAAVDVGTVEVTR